MNLTNLLSGMTILEKTYSKYNGEIEVIKDFTWGAYIKVGGLTQSGGIITRIWQDSLESVLKGKPHIKDCLILGLGGGTVAKLVSQYWVDTKITGIDIDKKMINLGKKYLGLDKVNINIKIEDASDFDITLYDLILVDLYTGDKFPEKFEKEKFLTKVKNSLNLDGIAIFNHLYGTSHRREAIKFGRALEKVFKRVEYIYPQANIMYICYN